jgi:lipopolysaccharide transport system permease protein
MEKADWLYEIKPQGKLIDVNFKEIWRYRDLLWMFVKRDIVTVYKQTILGPLWFLIQPLLTSVIFTLVFNNFGGIEAPMGINGFLFNLAGITMWNYFKDCLTGTSNTFRANQNIFGKVYFPRVIIPLSVTISNLMKLGIQFLIFIAFAIYFHTQGEAGSPQGILVFLPVLIISMGLMGLGSGLVVSSLTTKYRDLSVLVSFGVQLLMYVSAVPYSLDTIRKKGGWAQDVLPFIEYNPLTQVIVGFRGMTLGANDFDVAMLLYALGTGIVIFILGLIIFNRTERNFIDTV